MHSLERKQRADALASHRLERATCVAHAVFRVSAANGVRNSAGEPFYTRVPALGAITANEISATRNFTDQFRNIGGIVLQITVDQNEECPARGLQPGINRGALSGIFFETDHSQIRRGFNAPRG